MAKSLDKLLKKLYFKRTELLFDKAFNEGKITEFDEEIYEKMDGTIVSCLPVSLYIKYSKYLFPEGTCYDRSLYMFLALDDALLVRGNNKDLEYKYGKNHAGHGWIEIGNYVYDPSLMLRFEKDVYYRLYGCSDVHKIDKATYAAKNQKFIDDNVCTDFNEFRPGGKKRLELGVLIMQIKSLCSFINDDKFTKELNEYLSFIEYDEEEIREEREKAIQKIFKNKNFKDLV